jgi:AraC-like DNA-binding protein
LQRLLQLCTSRLDAVSIDGAHKFVNTDWAVPPNRRTDFEMIYMLGGTAQLELHGRFYTASKGDVFLIDNADGNACHSGEFSLLFCTFSIQEPMESVFFKEIKDCFSQLHGSVSVPQPSELEPLFLSMIKDLMLKPSLYESNASLQLMRIWIKLYREIELQLRNQTAYRNPKYVHMVNEIISFLWDHLHENTPLADISARWGLNPRFINRIFKETTGYPIIHYRKRMRIELAKQLLKEKNVFITDICEQLGFANSQHFSRAFKQITRTTPSEYKRG